MAARTGTALDRADRIIQAIPRKAREYGCGLSREDILVLHDAGLIKFIGDEEEGWMEVCETCKEGGGLTLCDTCSFAGAGAGAGGTSAAARARETNSLWNRFDGD
tara:strand:+ start:276 stop:590 length:315 start_codon:yes stop_codon:yes gene_type:complete